jgi:hypothetical protein
MPPWEKYQSAAPAADGPWTKYGTATPAPPAAPDPMTDREAWESSMPVRALRGIEGPAISLLKMVGPDSMKQQLGEIDQLRESGMKKRGNEGFDWAGLLGSLIPGGAIASGVTKVLPAATSLAGKMGVGAVAGGAAAGAQPLPGNNELSTDKLKQMGGGAVAGAVIPAAVQAAMGIKAAAEPFYDAGRKAIIGRTLNTAAGGRQPQAIQALETAKELVPGSRPTVAQASQNAGLASLERAATATSPEATVAAQMRTADQNAARVAALQKVAGTPQAMADAVRSRKLGTAGLIDQVKQSTAEVNPARTVSLIDKIVKGSPGRTQLTSTLENVKKSLFEHSPIEQRAKDAWTAVNTELKRTQHGLNDSEALSTMRTVLDRVKNGRIGLDEAMDQVKGLKGATPEAIAALDDAKAALKADDYKLRSNVSQLYQGARKNVTDLLSAKAGDGSKLNEAISRELSVVLKSLDHQINKAEPAYGQYLSKYTDLSRPINQMQIGQEVAGKATNATGDVHLNALVNALTDRTAQKATGFKRATLEGVLTPDQLSTLNAVKGDLVRSVQARNMAGTAGSDTVRKLAYTNLIDRAGVPTFLREFAPTQMVGNFLARGADSIYGRANNEIAEQLAQTLMNPQAAAQMMRQVGPSRYAAIIDAITNQAAGAAGTTVGRNQ